mgnify:CR=1 FL=1
MNILIQFHQIPKVFLKLLKLLLITLNHMLLLPDQLFQIGNPLIIAINFTVELTW